MSFQLSGEIVASITTNWLTPFRKRTIEVATKEGYYEADLMAQDLTEYSEYQRNNSYMSFASNVKKESLWYVSTKHLLRSSEQDILMVLAVLKTV